ncbi:MAG: cytochrome C [Deltaproteobacteria bacterium]|nr:cytochrome C [Deltaproteobacteria bacterium]
MYDGGKIITGIIIFIVLVLFPFWYTAASGQGGNRPDPETPKGEKSCVESKEYMSAWHMDMIDTWRDSVVRDGNRMYTAEDGTKYEMSLSKTCMKCHTDQEKFCNECHSYTGVEPYCWDCHVTPKGN